MFTQITLTSTSTPIHHAAAWLQATFDLPTVAAWALTAGGVYCAIMGAVVATVALLERS